MKNYAFCNSCRSVVEASHTEHDGKIFLLKNCPQCGETEAILSNRPELYRKKRDFMADISYEACHLDCLECEHKVPNIAFVELTNRCNMNCPICITNVPSMGFQFEPDRNYFELIFKELSRLDPRPSVQLFGGEPTVREDLFDIIQLARSYGLNVRVVTNGLKLADRDYCAQLVRQGASILISFDGFERKQYEIFRAMPEAFDLKLKALENINELGMAKVVLMTVVSREQDDDEFKKLFALCRKYRKRIRGIFLLPLVHMWSPDRLDYNPERTTSEDVEKQVERVIGGKVEFVPLGSFYIEAFKRILPLKTLPFVGVHPNCESITLLVSDGEKYLPVSTFLKKGLFGFIGHVRKIGRTIQLKKNMGVVFKIRMYLVILNLIFRHFNFSAAVGETGCKAFLKYCRMIGKLAKGRKLKDVLREDTIMKGALQVIVLPFEDYDTAEGERLKLCSSSFAFPDIETGKVRYVPVCAWEWHKKVIMKRIAEKYNKPGFTKGLERTDHVATAV